MTAEIALSDGDALKSKPRAPIWLLALVTFSGTLAMHIFVPALPFAGADLGVGIGTIQMTISIYIVGLALGQLVYGPLSDRLGRKPTLMAGLALYTVSGLAAALAPDANILIAARLFQALGGCSGLVLGRAIIRDSALPQDAARRLALMNLITMIGPGLAPSLGSLLASDLGWRSIFFALTVFGVANSIFCWRVLPETAKQSTGSGQPTLAANYWTLLKSPVFLGYSIGGGCATTSIYAFIASAPFIFQDQLHRTSQEVGIYLGIVMAGVWLGSALMSRLAGTVAISRLLVGASLLSLVSALVFLVAVLSGTLSVAWSLGPVFVFSIGAGIASPAALTEAISVNPRVIGSASGLYGFAQMAVAALCTTFASLGNDTALASAMILFGAALIGQAAFWLALTSQKRDRSAAARSVAT